MLSDALAVYAPPGVTEVGPPSSWGPWLLFPAESRTRTAIDRRLRAIGAPVVVEMESHQPEVLVEMVRLGLGWTVLPTAQAEHGPHRLARAMAEPLLTQSHMRLAIMATGPLATASRLSLPALGSRLVYVHLDGATALGQPSHEDTYSFPQLRPIFSPK